MVWITINVPSNDPDLDLSESKVRSFYEVVDVAPDRTDIQRLVEIEEVVVYYAGHEAEDYDEEKIHEILIDREREQEEWEEM